MADPITAVGLALAIVPLLISAAENYEITFQPFVTYRRHVKEVQRFHAKLGAQRTIFFNECELLYAAISNSTSWADVIKDFHHPSRNDEELSKRLEALLGSSYDACVSTLDLINQTLGKVCQETKGFQDILEDKTQRKAKGKGSLFIFRQKIKISFSKQRLDHIVDELRCYNEDLFTLSRQMRELAAQRSVEQPKHTASSKVITHLQDVQMCSSMLHDILTSRWSCNERTEHVVSMSLNVETAEKCDQKASKVRFNLLLTCIPENPASQQEQLRLKIESGPSAQASPQVVMGGVAKDPSSILQTKPHSVRFEVPSKADNTFITKTGVAPRDVETFPDTMLDLSTIDKLCQYFQKQQHRQAAGNLCIGFLERSEKFKHFVYPSPNPQASSTIIKRRLKEILWKDFDEHRQEAWTEKLNLARLLTLAVLRFQATPWLAQSWSSSDISFCSVNERPHEIASLQSPFLDVKIQNASSQPQQLAHPEYNASSISPNSTLYSLGVVLLELGYDAPLEALRDEDDLKGGASSQFTDFFTASRLSKLVSKRLNLRYGKLVQKCLTCNFGVGTELESPELQSAIIVNVVNELDECLKNFDSENPIVPSFGNPI